MYVSRFLLVNLMVLWTGVSVIPLAAERVEVGVVAGSRLVRLDNYREVPRCSAQ